MRSADGYFNSLLGSLNLVDRYASGIYGDDIVTEAGEAAHVHERLSPASNARSISAFLKIIEVTLYASVLIGQLKNWSMSFFGSLGTSQSVPYCFAYRIFGFKLCHTHNF